MVLHGTHFNDGIEYSKCRTRNLSFDEFLVVAACCVKTPPIRHHFKPFLTSVFCTCQHVEGIKVSVVLIMSNVQMFYRCSKRLKREGIMFTFTCADSCGMVSFSVKTWTIFGITFVIQLKPTNSCQLRCLDSLNNRQPSSGLLFKTSRISIYWSNISITIQKS